MASSSFFLLLLLLPLPLLLLLLLFRGEDTRRGFVSHLYKALRQKPINYSSSSSSSGLRWKYDVFINFRGEDTRRGFVSHLYKALRQKPINTFIDGEELRKGDRISEPQTAIQESRISIVVFSQNYASSTWCLKELVQILECNDTKNQIVLPIFYQVNPSDIRKLKGSFAEAFDQHEGHSNADVEEVRSWRSALSRATNLSGWDSQNYEDDAKLIEEIVEDVYRKLIHISSTSSKAKGLIGMDSHMHEMHLLLHPPGVETNDVRVVGIWGMGGLGKTTIARAVYDEIAGQFETRCFLENVKEGFVKHGRLHMRTQLLSSISNNKVGSSNILDKGFQVMLNRLSQRKVLIVIDDVNKLEQIEALLGEQHSSFGGGSRIIITTRDLQLLSITDAIYKPDIFSDPEALELFKHYAFRTKQPTRDYDDLTSHAIKYAQGLPLALKVLGASLDNKTIGEWKDVLKKLKEAPLVGVNNVLKTNFDELDRKEQNIFLDIACFFKGMKEDYATEILDSCGFYPHAGIGVLIDRALITVSVNGELGMHDLLEKMGREIVRQESIKEPGGRSRLWSYEDVYRVLTQNTATRAVQSIILDLSCSDEVCFNAEAFVSMTQLRLLKISHKSSIFKHDYCKQRLIGHLKFLSHELRCLSWAGFPLQSLPSNCLFTNLVDLDMQSSLIDRLWEGTQTLEKLKFINLSYCQYLKETPDFTKMPNLEKLILQSCIRLVEVHPSIWTHTNLVLLNLKGCKELKSLPSSIHMKSLQRLDLSGCSSLEVFPEIPEVMEELSWLSFSGSKIKELPSSINNLTGLTKLILEDCKELKSLPSSIHMKSLQSLDLFGCSSLEMFPEIPEVMEELSWLSFSESKIKELPSSINNLMGLTFLSLKDCKELKSLPSSIHMKSLQSLDLSGCSSLKIFPEIPEVMEELSWLSFSGSKIKELPSSINNLTGLTKLILEDCKELKSLPSSIHMKSLQSLDFSGCSSLEMFPEIPEVMEELSWLSFSESKIKELPSSINNLTGLNHLVLEDCKELKSFPSSICMKSLKTLKLSGCLSLEMFPEISEVMEELTWFSLSGSKIKELPSSINNLTGLTELILNDCKELKSLPSSIRMKSLKILDLFGCSSLEMFPEIPEVMEELSWLRISKSKIKELPSLPSSIRMKSLQGLDISGCSSLEIFPEIPEVMEKLSWLRISKSKIKELPSSINNLTGLKHLVLEDCKELKSLPSSIHMKSLEGLDISGCSSLEIFPEIPEVMEKLSWLNLSGSKIKELPSSINNLTGLNHLVLEDCKELQSLPSSIHMKSLEGLYLSGCSSLEKFPENSEVMEELSWLSFSGSKIKELPSLPSNIRMKSLKRLNLSGCSSLEMFPEISEVMEELSWLTFSRSKIKELPSSINNLTGLSYLNLKDCKELKSLPSSVSMKSLKCLDLFGCSSVEMFLEMSEKLKVVEVVKFRDVISNEFYFHMYCDDLPVWGYIGKVEDESWEKGTNHAVDITEYIAIDVEFTYSVNWKATSTQFQNRMDKYRRASLLPVRQKILLSSLCFHKEVGWKYIHGDVFRDPPNMSLFCAVLGVGTQLLAIVVAWKIVICDSGIRPRVQEGQMVKDAGAIGCCFFVSHLNKGLDQKAVNTFIEAEELQRATTFRSSWQLLAAQAFNPSFFFKNYASSTWCLKELAQIMECVDAHKQIVVPVLYGVDPSDIRKQEVLQKLLPKHKRHSNAGVKEVQGWRSATIYPVGIRKIIILNFLQWYFNCAKFLSVAGYISEGLCCVYISSRFLKPDKKTVDLVGNEKMKASTNVRHIVLPCSSSARSQLIPDIIRCYSSGGRTIIFTETKEAASGLAEALPGARALHRDIQQGQREVTLAGFRSGKFLTLVTTNVAARGLDINDVQLIIQCEPPRDVEDYIHRSGRTGRAGNSGVAVMLYDPRRSNFSKIERESGVKFEHISAPQPLDIAKAVGQDAAEMITKISDGVIPAFKSVAEELLNTSGLSAVDLLAKALTKAAGYTEIKKRSLLSSMEDHVTVLLEAGKPIYSPSFAFGVLRRFLPEEKVESVKGMALTADGNGAVFYVASEDLDLFLAGQENAANVSITVLKSLFGGGGRFGRGGGGGFRNDRYSNNRSAGGGGGGRGRGNRW
ncbi:protein suppressor of npr1-1 [Pyrus ussuriensis x Pyrus communis]|uniref:DEAD-box ATP-dependent RNA helicase 7 n=1 Tax=Pyrus ussuriensis x Pyrus communis TaxID=2448454 RepID=A0A5N5FDR4_9ROSA|nr:protein suppressor of npr1-1 [Pyrus ussuriensis x Pyrus communis]